MDNKQFLNNTLDKLSQKEIKALKVKELDCFVDISSSPILSKCIQTVLKELKNARIPYTPHFWVSDEWHSPDGIPGVGVPFVLLHPRLIKLERESLGHCEGESEKECLKLLRHEIGHALDNAYHLRKNSKRQKLFGTSSTTYPSWYRPIKYSKQYINHLADNYAQAHPDEDWAETFAVWLDPKSNWKNRNYPKKVREKLLLVDEIMTSLKNKKAKNTKRAEKYHIKNMNISLRNYFINKQKNLKLASFSPYKKKLRPILSKANNIGKNSTSLANFLKENKEQISTRPSLEKIAYKYQIHTVLNDMIAYSQNISSNTQISSDYSDSDLRDYLETVLRKSLKLNMNRKYM